MTYSFGTNSAPRSRAHHWFFTENNPVGALDGLFESLRDNGTIEYCAWQLEIGEEGTEHYQGYVQFRKQTYFSTVAKILPRANWQLCIDPSAARAYCLKNDSRIEGPYELGTWVAPATKMSVWKTIRDEIVENKRGDMWLLNNHPAQVFMYAKGIANVRNLVSVPRDFKTHVILIVGKPGVGKSRVVFQTYPGAFWKAPDGIWFDGYRGEQVMVFDDFHGWLPHSSLLRLCDRYPLLLQTKGAHANMEAKRLVLTSNYLPRAWYPNVYGKHPLSLQALNRRIDELIIARSEDVCEWDFYEGMEAQNILASPLAYGLDEYLPEPEVTFRTADRYL